MDTYVPHAPGPATYKPNIEIIKPKIRISEVGSKPNPKIIEKNIVGPGRYFDKNETSYIQTL